MQNPFKIALWIGILILVGIIVIAEDGKVSVSEERVNTVLDNTEKVVNNLQRAATSSRYERCCPYYGFTYCCQYVAAWEEANEQYRLKYGDGGGVGKVITPEMRHVLDNRLPNSDVGK